MALARIQTPDPKRGRNVRTYSWRGQKYEAGKGWYKVSKAIGNELRAFHNVDGDEESPEVFVVCETEVEAKAYDAAEAKKRAPRSTPDDPTITVRDTESGGSFTTADLPEIGVPPAAAPARKGPPPRAAAPAATAGRAKPERAAPATPTAGRVTS